MIKKIELISELNKRINDSLICLVQDTVTEGKEHYIYTYLTSNYNFSLTINDSFVEGDCSTLDLINKDFIETPIFQGFYGEVFNVATISEPKYATYLSYFEKEKIEIDYLKPIYMIKNDDFYELTFIKEESDGMYAVSTEFGDLYLLDLNGRDNEGSFVATNHNNESLSKIFEEESGYLFLGQVNGPKYMSQKAKKIIKNYTDIGYDENEYIQILPVINFKIGTVLFDTIIVDGEREEVGVKINRTKTEKYKHLSVPKVIENEGSYNVDDSIFEDIPKEFNKGNRESTVSFEKDHELFFEEDIIWDEEIEIELFNDDDDDDLDEEIDLEEEDL